MKLKRENRIKRVIGLGLLAKLGLVLAIVAEWAAGSACLTPQVIKEVQMAKPLPPKETGATVSGGITWAVPTGGGSTGAMVARASIPRDMDDAALCDCLPRHAVDAAIISSRGRVNMGATPRSSSCT